MAPTYRRQFAHSEACLFPFSLVSPSCSLVVSKCFSVCGVEVSEVRRCAASVHFRFSHGGSKHDDKRGRREQHRKQGTREDKDTNGRHELECCRGLIGTLR